MTQKHFIALADTFRTCKPNPAAMGSGAYIDALTQWAIDRNYVADFCAIQNPNFDRQRWLDYIDGKCGPNGGKLK